MGASPCLPGPGGCPRCAAPPAPFPPAPGSGRGACCCFRFLQVPSSVGPGFPQPVEQRRHRQVENPPKPAAERGRAPGGEGRLGEHRCCAPPAAALEALRRVSERGSWMPRRAAGPAFAAVAPWAAVATDSLHALGFGSAGWVNAAASNGAIWPHVPC